MIRAFRGTGLLMLGLCPAWTAAQSVFTRQVRAQLVENSAAANVAGLTLSHEPEIGSLDHGQSRTFHINLRAGTTYLLTAVCDEDCDDVDLKLLSPGMAEVARDVARDDRPAIVFTPRRTGEYHLRVIMASCTRAPCRFGLGVFSDADR